MTVTSETQKVEYDGTGEDTALAVPFNFYESSDLIVTQRVTATGVGTVLTEATHYTVTGGSGSEGTVTPVDGATDFPTTVTWVIKRDLPLTQELDYIESGAFRAESHEEGLDRAVMLSQQLLAAHTRMLRIPDGDDINLDMELPDADDRASKYLTFNAEGEPTATDSVVSSTVTVTGFMETLLDDSDGPEGLETLGILQDTFANIPAAGTAGRVFIATDTGLLYVDNGVSWVGQSSAGQGQNLIVNGCCRIWQRGTSFTNTGTYVNTDGSPLMDHIFLLSDGDDIVDVSQETSIIPTGAYSAIKLDVETGSKKFGLLFPIESRDAATIIGGTASLSFKARTDAGLTVRNVRAAILSWDGTADAITKDVVTVWQAEGTNPTWATNWTLEGDAPTNFTLSAAYQTFSVENVSIDTSGATNVAVFIWVDDTTDLIATDVLYISEVKLEKGSTATDFFARSFDEEYRLCRRYYRKSFPLAVAPVQNVGDFLGCEFVIAMRDSGDMYLGVTFESNMLKVPTVVTFNPTVADAKWRRLDDVSSANVSVSQESERGFMVALTGGSTTGSQDYGIHWDADAEIDA